MLKQKKIMLKKWAKRIVWLLLAIFVVWANVKRLQNNVYSNYEKAVDYGLIKDDDEPIKPIIAAIFYNAKDNNKGHITTYFNHSDNYKKQNVKIVVVPQQITEYSRSVIEKLYAEIRKYNNVKNIMLVYDEPEFKEEHNQIIKTVMGIEKISELQMKQGDVDNEKNIEDYLNQENSMLIVLADLDKGISRDNGEYLTDETLYFAQKFAYHLNVFDVIDTKIAQALEKDYNTMFPSSNEEKTALEKQKENLERYKNIYIKDIIAYFKDNLKLLQEGKNVKLPEKNEKNYRLYDRGSIVLEAYDENLQEIYEKFVPNQSKGIIISIIDALENLMLTEKAEKAKFFKIYLMTEMEYINKDADTMLMSYLDSEDGVFAVYHKKSAVMLTGDRPFNPEDLAEAIRNKAGIPQTVNSADIDFYKFKTVEIEYGY